MSNQGHQVTRSPSHQKKNSVDIFILIDALGWDYIKDRSFLNDIAVTKRPVKSILGFSSGVIPSILTGKYPQEHKHWSLYFYSPKTSPFRWTKCLFWLPKKVLNSRISRKIIEEISKRVMGYSGYFETYLISVEKMHLFDICENRNIYAPKGIRGAESIFDVLRRWKIENRGWKIEDRRWKMEYRNWNYPLKDNEIIENAKNSLGNKESIYYFLYLSELDALLHKACHDKAKVNEAIDYHERQVREIYNIAQKNYKNVNLFVFSDHSMAPVNSGFDLKKEIEDLGFEISKDYIAFYDSTMVRFWFFNPKARDAVVGLLKNKEYGSILSDSELERLGVKFENDMYGEVIFLVNTGSVINPSYMGNKMPQGMHGYGVDDGQMDAVLVSNKKVDIEIKDVKDFFELMSPSHQVTKSPGHKVKIVYFLNSLVRGGVEEHVLRLIEGLDKRQFEPILVCPQALIDLMKPDLEEQQIKFYPICIRKWSDIKEIKKFFDIMKLEKPDIVHSHLFFATMFAAPLAKLAGVPKVIETAHIREAWRKGIKKAYFIDRFFYRFVDRVIAVSNAIKKYLVTEKRISEYKIDVIRNGVDLSKFKALNTQYPIPNTKNGRPFTIGVIGRLEPQKGHRYFLEAIKMLGSKGDNAVFSIIGDGALRADLEGMSRDFKIENKVKFLGFRKDIREIIAELDLVVLPSLYEGLPLVAIEAGAMGKPMIVTNVDGSPEAVVDNRTGFVVPTKDSAAIGKRIEIFLNNRDLTKEFGKNARQYIAENFDGKSQITKTGQLYLIILNKSK